jgi:hypothetical protein
MLNKKTNINLDNVTIEYAIADMRREIFSLKNKARILARYLGTYPSFIVPMSLDSKFVLDIDTMLYNSDGVIKEIKISFYNYEDLEFTYSSIELFQKDWETIQVL